MSDMLPLEIQFYNKCKLHESQLVANNSLWWHPMYKPSPVGTNIKNAHNQGVQSADSSQAINLLTLALFTVNTMWTN